MPVARGMSPTPPEQSQAISLKPREKLLLSTAVNAEMILASKDVAIGMLYDVHQKSQKLNSEADIAITSFILPIKWTVPHGICLTGSQH